MLIGDANVIIVGGGQAGARAAQAMRLAGFAGSIRIIGDEQHLPYERPQLSKAFLLDPNTAVPFALRAEVYAELKLEVTTGARVEAIDRADRTVTLTDGSQYRYDQLLLATGSKLRFVTLGDYPQADILGLRTIDDARAIAARVTDPAQPVVIVGGGFIGLEVAASLAQRGCKVTVLEAADRLLPRLGCPEVSALVLDHHRATGIDIRLGSTVIGGSPGRLALSDGTSIDAAFVVMGIGVSPNTDLAAAAGLAIDDGIVVDASGRTADPLIFAVGDATRHYNAALGRHVRLESWENANLQAEAVGRTMAGFPQEHDAIPWLWSDQGKLNLQMAGAPASIDRTVIRRSADAEDGVSVLQLHENRLVGGLTFNRGKDMTLIRRLIAAGTRIEEIDALADDAVPLRSFMRAKAAA